jgi:hypothetical protein
MSNYLLVSVVDALSGIVGVDLQFQVTLAHRVAGGAHSRVAIEIVA